MSDDKPVIASEFAASFIRELMRKAALFAAERSADATLQVRDEHMDAAMHELIVEGGVLTQQLLGASRPSTRAPSC